jgi:hypothetical protein
VSKHTPGPWRAYPATNRLGDVFLGYWLVDGPDNAGVADLFGEVRGEQDEDGDDKRLPDAEIEANARLIVAAPDLLAACKRLLDAMHMQEKRESEEFHITSEVALCIWRDAQADALAAIAKAQRSVPKVSEFEKARAAAEKVEGAE